MPGTPTAKIVCKDQFLLLPDQGYVVGIQFKQVFLHEAPD